MSYNIVLTTAEDIVAVVDAVVAKGASATKEFIFEFTGIATEDQVLKALHMAQELQLVKYDTTTNVYDINSFLAKKLVTSLSDDEKAIFMRMIIEQYPPYNTFRTRYEYSQLIDVACRQTKVLYNMTSHERDIKNTLVSIATYAKALKSEGANLYSFMDADCTADILEFSLKQISLSESSLKVYWGAQLYEFVDRGSVFDTLSEALIKSKASPLDANSVIVYSANAFESFLSNLASALNITLAGKNGILQKRDALSAHLSKKHRGMIDYIGQVRNAADHGADVDENNQCWIITKETATIFPLLVAIVIKDIYTRYSSHSIEV